MPTDRRSPGRLTGSLPVESFCQAGTGVRAGMSQSDAVFAELLRARRRTCGLSQAVLAELAGMSVRAISDLERGRTRSPYPDSVRRLADALGLRDLARDEFFAAAGRPISVRAPASTESGPV